MTTPYWHAEALFGPGPRRALTRDQRALLRLRLRAARIARHITALHEQVALEALHLLGGDGRLDPAQATLARRAGCCLRTVSTALRRMRALGLIDWVQRLVRAGRRVEQTSNAYAFRPEAVIPPPFRCARKPCAEGSLHRKELAIPDRAEALAALARIAESRLAAMTAAWGMQRTAR